MVVGAHPQLFSKSCGVFELLPVLLDHILALPQALSRIPESAISYEFNDSSDILRHTHQADLSAVQPLQLYFSDLPPG